MEPDRIPAVLELLRARFGDRLQIGPSLGLGLDGAAGDLFLDGARLTVDWDIWSGLFLMAWDEAGDRLVRRIAAEILKEEAP